MIYLCFYCIQNQYLALIHLGSNSYVLLFLSETLNLSPTLFFEMTGFKAFFDVATINVQMLSYVRIIGISEMTLSIGMIPNSTDSDSNNSCTFPFSSVEITHFLIVLLSASFS